MKPKKFMDVSFDTKGILHHQTDRHLKQRQTEEPTQIKWKDWGIVTYLPYQGLLLALTIQLRQMSCKNKRHLMMVPHFNLTTLLCSFCFLIDSDVSGTSILTWINYHKWAQKQSNQHQNWNLRKVYMIKKPDAQIPNHTSLKTDRHTKMNNHELLHKKWAWGRAISS